MTLTPNIIIHGPHSKPLKPPVGDIRYNKEKDFHEKWMGNKWIPVIMEDDPITSIDESEDDSIDESEDKPTISTSSPGYITYKNQG